MMDRKSTPVFFSQYWIDAFRKNILQKPQVYRSFYAQENQGVLPFYLDTHSQVLHSMTNYYSPYFGLFNASNNHEIELEKVLESSSPQLTVLPLLQSQVEQIQQQINPKYFYTEVFYHTTNWRHKDINNFEDFKRACSKSLIKATERYTRKLFKSDDFNITIYRNTFSSEIYNDYCNVFKNSWKTSEPYPEFIRDIYAAAAKLDQLRIGIIYHFDIPVSAQAWFSVNDTAYIYKLAYDEEYSDRRVGNVLLLKMAEEVIKNDGVKTIDFLTGDDSYKSKWMNESRPLFGICIYNKSTLTGRVRSIKAKIKNAVKTYLPKSKSI